MINDTASETTGEINSKKPKALIYLIVLVAVILIIVIFFYIGRNTDKGWTKEKLLVLAEHELKQCKADLQNFYLGVLKNDVSYCEKIKVTLLTEGPGEISTQNMKQSCEKTIPLIEYYLTKISSDKCTNLPSNPEESDYGVCKEVLKCIETGDQGYCNSTLSNDIYKFFKANKDKQISMCEDIVDLNTKSYCKIIISSDIKDSSYTLCDEGYERLVVSINNETSY